MAAPSENWIGQIAIDPLAPPAAGGRQQRAARRRSCDGLRRALLAAALAAAAAEVNVSCQIFEETMICDNAAQGVVRGEIRTCSG